MIVGKLAKRSAVLIAGAVAITLLAAGAAAFALFPRSIEPEPAVAAELSHAGSSEGDVQASSAGVEAGAGNLEPGTSTGAAGAPPEEAPTAQASEQPSSQPAERIETEPPQTHNAITQPEPEPATSQSPEASRTWVVDYEDVWVPDIEVVVDEPEHEEPIYETRHVLVCSTCGYEAAGGNDMGAHLSAHAMKGEADAYSSLPRRVQVGTTTVPAVTHEVDSGHFERIEAGGHWE